MCIHIYIYHAHAALKTVNFQQFSVARRHLFLCQVLYDPLSGDMVPVPSGTQIHVEMGAVVGQRDLHSMRTWMVSRGQRMENDGEDPERSLLLMVLFVISHEFFGS